MTVRLVTDALKEQKRSRLEQITLQMKSFMYGLSLYDFLKTNLTISSVGQPILFKITKNVRRVIFLFDHKGHCSPTFLIVPKLLNTTLMIKHVS